MVDCTSSSWNQPPPPIDCLSGPDGCGRLWGVTHGVSNNTNWRLASGSNDGRHSPMQAIPFRSIHNSIDAFVIYLRNDDQSGNFGTYTTGDGGTLRAHIVGDNNCQPDMNNILWTSQETVGDASQWSSEGDFLASYPNAQWIPGDSPSLSAQQHDTGGIAVTRCGRYWIVVEQVDGGSTNSSSINYFRSGYSVDFAINMISRFYDPCSDPCSLPMTLDNGVWNVFERHPIFNVLGDQGVQGIPYYNKGIALDDEPGNDRMANVNSSGDKVRNIWTVPGGEKTLCMVHVAAALNGSNLGTGDLVISIDGNQVGAIPHSDFLVSETEVNPTALDDLRYRSILIPDTVVSGTAIFELTSTGDADFEIGSLVEALTLSQQAGRFFTQVGTSGTPDVASQVSLNGGAYQSADTDGENRLKHCIAYNEKADGTPGNCLDCGECPPL